MLNLSGTVYRTAVILCFACMSVSMSVSMSDKYLLAIFVYGMLLRVLVCYTCIIWYNHYLHARRVWYAKSGMYLCTTNAYYGE